MDKIIEMGMKIVQGFLWIPGLQEIINTSNFTQLYTALGFLVIASYIGGIFCIIFGIVKFGIKKSTLEKNGSSEKPPHGWLIGGIVGGGVLILLPSITMIVGAILSSSITG